MFRLAYDIISSMPIKFYNSYTLFQMAAIEGETAFREAVDRYIPLELSEVGMAIELQNKLAEYGPGYAQIAVADPSMSNETYRLMQQVVNGYNVGDTAVVRSALNALQDAPFYYMTATVTDKNSTMMAGAKSDDVVGVSNIKKLVLGEHADKLYYNGLIFLKKFPQERVEQATGKINFNDDIKNQAFEVVRGPFDTTVQGVLKFGDKLDKVATPTAQNWIKPRLVKRKSTRQPRWRRPWETQGCRVKLSLSW